MIEGYPLSYGTHVGRGGGWIAKMGVYRGGNTVGTKG